MIVRRKTGPGAARPLSLNGQPRRKRHPLAVVLSVAVVASLAASGLVVLLPGAAATSVVTTISLAAGASPFQGIYDAAYGAIFVSNTGSNQVSVISSITHTSPTHLSGGACLTGCTISYGVFDPNARLVDFATSGGSFEGFQLPSFSYSLSSCTGYTPESVAYDPANAFVYGFAQSSSGGELDPIHGTAGNTCLALAGIPWFGAYAPSNYTMWVAEGASGSSGQVQVLNSSTSASWITSKKVLPVGSAPGYPAFDRANGDMYIANQNSNNVTVINVKTYSTVANIAVGTSPDAVTYDPVNKEVYVANSGSSSVSAISSSSNTVVATIPVGSTPDSLTFDPANQTMVVTNSGSDNVSFIDHTDAISSTVALASGSSPETAVFDPADSYIYVPDHGTTASVSVLTDDPTIGVGSAPRDLAIAGSSKYAATVDSTANTVSVFPLGFSGTASTTIAVGTSPLALAYDAYNGEFYVANNGSDNVSVISTSTWRVTSTLLLPTGARPSNIIYDPSSHYVFVADWASNQVSVINPSNIVTNVAVHSHPLGMGIDTANWDVYVTDQGGSFVDVLGQTGAAVGSVAVGSGPVAVACSSSDCYVSNFGSGTVSVLSGTTVSATITVGTNPGAIAYDPADGNVYVADNGSAQVSVIGSGNTVVATLKVGTGPSAVVYDNSTGLIYVSNYGSNNVSTIAYTGAAPVVAGATPVGSGPVAMASVAMAGAYPYETIYAVDLGANDVRGL